MRKPRYFARPLSWLLTRLGSRDAKALEALRLSLAGSKPRPRTDALVEDVEDLLWTCR